MAQQVKAKAKKTKIRDKEVDTRRHILTFKKDAYTGISPIVNAFRSYWYQTTSDKNDNKIRELKIEKKMLSYLVSIIQNIPIPEANSLLIWQSAEIITAFVTKDDGTLMDDKSQIKKFCDFIFEKEGRQLCGRLYKENDPAPYYSTTEEVHVINLMIIRWNAGTYGMSTKMNLFCGKNMYCVYCKVGYDHQRDHALRCKYSCSSCFGKGPDFPCQQELADGTWIKCDKCNLSFKSVQCHEQHLKSACANQKKCKLCNHTYQIHRGSAIQHVCGNSYCYQCNQHHPPNNRALGKNYCYIQKAKIHPKDFLRVLYVFYDIETIQKVLKRLGKRANSCSEPSTSNKRARVEPSEDEPVAGCSHQSDPSEDEPVACCSHQSESNPSCLEDSGIMHATNMDHAIPEIADPIYSSTLIEDHEDADEDGILSREVDEEMQREILSIIKGASHLEHFANMLHSLIRCSDCIDDTSKDRYCTYCHRQSSTFTSIPERLLPSSSDENIVYDEDVTGAFMEYLLTLSQSSDYSAVYLYAHNAARFDSHLVLKAFTDRNYTTSQFIQKGNSIIEATISSGQGIEKSLHFRDTYTIIPVALRAFQESFSLAELLYKFDFPHFYNREEFYENQLDTLPDKEFFGYSNMKKAEKAKFDLKYDAECKKMEENGSKYLLPVELHKYCKQDVNILYEGFVVFRKGFNEQVKEKVDEVDISKLRGNANKQYYDVILKGISVASLCLYVYRLCYMPLNEVALIPETGYTDKTNQSKIAIGYLDWLMKKQNNFIQHANNIGEHKIGKISVDGYNIDTKEIIQVHGCLWHGCPRCYPDRTKILIDGKTAGDFYASTVEKAKRLDEAIDGNDDYSQVKVVWECDIRREMNMDDKMFKFINNTEDLSNIDLRKALNGGRTGPIRMKADAIEGVRKISYYDICSLYPYINFVTKYPIGHPEIKHNVPVYEYPTDIPEMAIIKCKVLAPENMELPILPMKFRSQLIFPICGRCPELYYDKNEGPQSCPHNDEGREFVTTITSQELLYAMHQGYELKKIYHVLEYKEGSDNIFKGYVRSFLKQKIEASEPPPNYSDPTERKKFEKLYKDIYDIDLDECKLNKGRRFIAKLCLNSLWGRFALNVHEEKKIVSTEEYYSYVRDPTIFDLSSHYLSDGTRMIRFKRDHNYVTGRNVNVMLSLWTTAAAKLHLYKFMKLIHLSPGCRLLYTDTDSIIYMHPWNFNPLTSGELLGEMTDEYPDKEIISYRSAGAKQYHLELADKDGVISTCTKIRGIVSNAETEKLIKKSTFDYNPNKTVILETTRIGPSNNLSVLTTNSTKIYRTVCKKGILHGHYMYPYGWKFGKRGYCLRLDNDVDNFSVRPFVFDYNFTGSSSNV